MQKRTITDQRILGRNVCYAEHRESNFAGTPAIWGSPISSCRIPSRLILQIAKHTTLSAISTVISVAGRLLITIHIARFLGPRVYGPLVFTQWCAETLAIVSSLGLPSVLTRYCSEIVSTRQPIRRARIVLFLRAAVGSLLLAAIVSASVFLWVERSEPAVVVILSICWTLAALSLSIANAANFGLLRFDLILLSNISYAATGLLASHTLITKGNVVSAMFVWILAALVGTLVSLGGLRLQKIEDNSHNEIQLTSAREMYRYALNTWIGQLTASILWTRGEMGVLRSLVSNQDIAHYGVATTLSGLVSQGVNLLQGGITPHLSLDWKRNNHLRIEKTLRVLSSLTFFASAIGALLCVLFAPEIVSILFGTAFAAAAPSLSIIAIGATAAGTGTINMAVQFSTNGTFQRNTTIIGAAALIFSAFILVKVLGIEGAALARTLTLTGIGFLTVLRLAPAGYPALSRTFLRRWVVAIALIIAAGMAENFLHLSLVMRSIIFVSGFVVIFWLFIGSLSFRRFLSEG